MKRLLVITATLFLVMLIAVPRTLASEGFEDLVKIVKSGTDEKALIAYIDSSPVAYALTVDEILFLSDLGLSSDMIRAVIEHGKKLAGDAYAGTQPAGALGEEMEDQGLATNQFESAVEPAMQVEEPLLPASLPLAEDAVQEVVADVPVIEAPQPESVDISTFYGSLSPYGSWLTVDGDSYWQPTAMVLNSSWSPYCHRGYWVYTDYGWMWQSNYSWGWAPFHYGRWCRHSFYGWIWKPDTVWGPAWVCWRHSDSAIGWAPLPPAAHYETGFGFRFHGKRPGADFEFGLESSHFTFVPVRHFCDRMLPQRRFSRKDMTHVYNRTSAIPDNYSYSNNRIINRGPPVSQIQAVTHQEIKRVAIMDQNIKPGQPIHPGRVSGETVTVYRPHVAPTARETPKAAVARRQASAQVRHEDQHKVAVIETYRSGSLIQAEQVRGKASLRDARAGSTPSVKSRSVPPGVSNQGQVDVHGKMEIRGGPADVPQQQSRDMLRQQQEQLSVQKAQRLAEETAARQREEEKQRADAFISLQQKKRNAEVLARQQNEQRRRDEEIARQREDIKRFSDELKRKQAEQQQRAADLARLQEQKKRDDDMRRQQEQQRKAQEQARQQEVQRQSSVEQLRQQQDLQKVLQARRQAEETAARQNSRQQPAQNIFQGYGTGPMINEDSKRGSVSRGTNTRSR